VSGLPQGGFGGSARPGRRRVFVIGVIVLFLVVGWSYGVLSYGRGEGAGDAAVVPNGNRVPGQASSADTAREEPQAVPEDNAHAAAPGDQRESLEGTAKTPAEASPGAPQASLGPAPHDHPEGAAGEPGSYDPLGTGASAGDLAPIDRERVRFAAARFVSAAYGYSGRDDDAYNQGVGATVVWPVFYESPGAAEIERYAAQVGESGTRSAALLTRFEVRKTTPGTAEGYAYFETGAGYGRDGELTGEKVAYRQRMTLARSGAVWKVRATEKIEEVR
jgi:hypothetical protein